MLLFGLNSDWPDSDLFSRKLTGTVFADEFASDRIEPGEHSDESAMGKFDLKAMDFNELGLLRDTC
jgi:hypothetical protein